MCHDNTKALAMAEGHVWVSGSVAMSELISKVHVTTEDCSEALGLVSHLDHVGFKSHAILELWRHRSLRLPRAIHVWNLSPSATGVSVDVHGPFYKRAS